MRISWIDRVSNGEMLENVKTIKSRDRMMGHLRHEELVHDILEAEIETKRGRGRLDWINVRK